MARPSLFRHRKFRHLARLLRGQAVAAGTLELLWHVAYEAGDDYLGTAEDVEDLADWRGKAGVCCAALVTAGFLDMDEVGGYRIHQLWDHCPEYVRKRRARETQRRDTTQSVSGQCPVSVQPVTGQRPSTDSPLNSTPFPSRTYTHTQAATLVTGSHKRHACCGYICLPGDLFAELVRKSGQPDEETGKKYVTAWFRRHNAQLEAEKPVIGEDDFAFWRGQWARDHPTKRVSLEQRREDSEVDGDHPFTWQCDGCHEIHDGTYRQYRAKWCPTASVGAKTEAS